MRTILLLVSFFVSFVVCSQQRVTIYVKDSISGIPLNAAIITLAGNNNQRILTDQNGKASIPNTAQNITCSFIGYETKRLVVAQADTLITILLSPQDNALSQVTVIASTRNNEPIENATTKVEVLGLEEMNEESTIKPGNIASILGDMSGIQIQQSSAVSGNANVRIQGLDGKYTQILRDGMPLYEGYSGGFGILSIPPLDLKQIELIKGAASTLYGGGAIGGLINLISKKPSFTPDASFLVNQTTLKETNVNLYYAQRKKHAGVSLFSGYTYQKQVDVNKDGFSDVPFTKSLVIHPTLFIYPDAHSSIAISWSGSFDNRNGGDMLVLSGKSGTEHVFFENNKLRRNTFTLLAENRFSSAYTLSVKSSISFFSRNETTNTFYFNGTQKAFYTELSLHALKAKHNIVAGINITGDAFKPSLLTPAPVGNFSNTTTGVFMQDTWTLPGTTKAEIGLRADHHYDYGSFLLPRIALFHKFSKSWGTRIGAGMGYKTPNPLVPQIKDYSIYQLNALPSGAKAETSLGTNVEINYKKSFGEENSFFINHAFFYTGIQHPLVAMQDADGFVTFNNAAKPIVTKGFDTYIQATVHDWEIYVGYTYTVAERKYLTQQNFMLLTPRNRAACVIAYEIEHLWRMGLEASYTGYQYREDFSKTPGYIFFAAMIERKFGAKWSMVLNGENLLDQRQSRFEALYTNTVTQPEFKPLWAPIDGIVINFSLRYKPFEHW